MTIDDVVDYRAVFARLAEIKADPAKRAKAMQSLNKSNEAAQKKERRAADQDDPAVASALRQQARADKSLANAKFKDAVTEAAPGDITLIAPPRGKRADHFDPQGKLIASTEWRGGELVTKSAGGAMMGKTVIR